MRTLYEILGIEESATVEEIKSAYKALSLILHPDKSKHDTNSQFIELKDAYEILIDSDRRHEYDCGLLADRKSKTQPTYPPSSWYEYLGIKQSADEKEIKLQYSHLLARIKNKKDLARLATITESLCDKEKKATYDRLLDKSRNNFLLLKTTYIDPYSNEDYNKCVLKRNHYWLWNQVPTFKHAAKSIDTNERFHFNIFLPSQIVVNLASIFKIIITHGGYLNDFNHQLQELNAVDNYYRHNQHPLITTANNIIDDSIETEISVRLFLSKLLSYFSIGKNKIFIRSKNGNYELSDIVHSSKTTEVTDLQKILSYFNDMHVAYEKISPYRPVRSKKEIEAIITATLSPYTSSPYYLYWLPLIKSSCKPGYVVVQEKDACKLDFEPDQIGPFTANNEISSIESPLPSILFTSHTLIRLLPIILDMPEDSFNYLSIELKNDLARKKMAGFIKTHFNVDIDFLINEESNYKLQIHTENDTLLQDLTSIFTSADLFAELFINSNPFLQEDKEVILQSEDIDLKHEKSVLISNLTFVLFSILKLIKKNQEMTKGLLSLDLSSLLLKEKEDHVFLEPDISSSTDREDLVSTLRSTLLSFFNQVEKKVSQQSVSSSLDFPHILILLDSYFNFRASGTELMRINIASLQIFVKSLVQAYLLDIYHDNSTSLKTNIKKKRKPDIFESKEDGRDPKKQKLESSHEKMAERSRNEIIFARQYINQAMTSAKINLKFNLINGKLIASISADQNLIDNLKKIFSLSITDCFDSILPPKITITNISEIMRILIQWNAKTLASKNKSLFLNAPPSPYVIQAEDLTALAQHYKKKYNIKICISGQSKHAKEFVDKHIAQAVKRHADFRLHPFANYFVEYYGSTAEESSYFNINDRRHFFQYFNEISTHLSCLTDFFSDESKCTLRKDLSDEQLNFLNLHIQKLSPRFLKFLIPIINLFLEKLEKDIVDTKIGIDQVIINEILCIQKELFELDSNEYIGYIFSTKVPLKNDNFEAIIIHKDKLIKPLHSSLSSEHDIKIPDIYSTQVVLPTTYPHNAKWESGSLAFLYLKELLKNNAEQLISYSLTVDIESSKIFIPSPQVLKYTNNEFNTKLAHFLIADFSSQLDKYLPAAKGFVENWLEIFNQYVGGKRLTMMHSSNLYLTYKSNEYKKIAHDEKQVPEEEFTTHSSCKM